jgi:type I restriction enzyme S subunit
MGEFEVLTLGELGADQPSAFATGPFGSPVSAKNFVTKGVPMLRGSNLSDQVGVRLDESDLVFVSEELASRYVRSIVHPGDLVFTCWGTVGQLGLIGSRNCFDRYLVSNKQMKVTVDRNRVVPLFLYYYLSQNSMIELVRGQAIGSSVPVFNLGQLKSLPIRLPQPDVQRSIVEVLGALDDKIAANEQIANATAELLAAAFWALGIEREPLGDAELVRLAEIVDLNPRESLSCKLKVPYLDMKNLPDVSMTVSNWSRRDSVGGARFRNGDTLMARITPCLENGKTGFIDFLPDGEVAVGSTEFIVMRPIEGIPAVLPYFLAKSERFREFAIRHMVGTSGRQRLSASDLRDYPLTRPDEVELRKFADLSTQLMKRVRCCVDESRLLARTRDALLPALMSGKLRVKDVETVDAEGL